MFKYREKEGLRGVVVLDLFLLGFGVAGSVSMFKNLSLVPLDQSSLEAGSGAMWLFFFVKAIARENPRALTEPRIDDGVS